MEFFTGPNSLVEDISICPVLGPVVMCVVSQCQFV